MKLKIITVDNGTIGNYPGSFAKKELEIIKYNSKGRVLSLFSGRCGFGYRRVDLSCEEATHIMDVFDFLFENELIYNTIIIDAPYNQRFADKYQKIGNTSKQFIIFADFRKTTLLWHYILQINPEIIILKSWNYYIPKGYHLREGYLCYAGGYRKPTILEILEVDP